ncbi:MAG: VacJ family lipoprotein [Steroidobacteraceae bacterium]|nr:VacJ family lipoprotein [Steroidobacteraceae bacterium]
MLSPRSARAALLACTLFVIAAGPAVAAEQPRNRDPLERLNRATYAFNDALDRMIAKPLARAYREVVPEPARNAVSNFVTNLEYPGTIVNNALQGKFSAAGTDTLRFLVNSTIGIGGLADPATRFGIPSHDEDFGQTFGYWGLPSGPYLVLPVFGPSTLRDAPGRFADRYTNVRRHIGDGSTEEYVLLGVDVLDTRTELLSVERLLEGAFDPYARVRDAYLARREFLVTDGEAPADDYEFEEELPEEIPVDAPTETSIPESAPASATEPESAPPSGSGSQGS